jgi:hypothetical protein
MADRWNPSKGNYLLGATLMYKVNAGTVARMTVGRCLPKKGKVLSSGG